MTTHTLIVQKWTESERGWGTRPDGYSLHLSEVHLKRYVEEYWARMPNSVPDEYSYPDGTPYTFEADAETYEKVKASSNGIRSYERNYPGSGGIDGWRQVR
jgi:hypothetical protein